MSKKEDVISLWRTCFSDSEAFIAFYFRDKYKDENALVSYSEAGEPIAALQLIPHQMSFCGSIIDVSYISGACTDPLHRGKGLMKKLLIDSFQEMANRGFSATILIPAAPWLFDFYQKMGYVTLFEYQLEEFVDVKMDPNSMYEALVVDPQTDLLAKMDPQREQLLHQTYTYFSSKQHQLELCVLLSFDDFWIVCKDHTLAKGAIIVIFGLTGAIEGVAFTYPNENRVFVNEWFYEQEDSKKSLLAAISAHYQCNHVVCKSAAGDNGWIPFGMIQIIDLETIWTLYVQKHPDAKQTVSLADLGISDLTHLIFDSPMNRPRMRLMLD